jgi:hypothetical protein
MIRSIRQHKPGAVRASHNESGSSARRQLFRMQPERCGGHAPIPCRVDLGDTLIHSQQIWLLPR